MTIKAQSDFAYCRAGVSDDCEESRLKVIDDEDSDGGATEDGTYDHETHTYVCDACYIELMPLTPSGRALRHELPAAIERARSGASVREPIAFPTGSEPMCLSNERGPHGSTCTRHRFHEGDHAVAQGIRWPATEAR